MQPLFKHQSDFLSQNHDKTSLVWSCGCGKTRAAIEWLKRSHGGTGLIVCPKALKENWQRELEKYGYAPRHLRRSNFVMVISKEELRRDWQKLEEYSQIIVDEVHNGFLTPNFKSAMSKALKKYLHMHKVPRVLLLSATVYTSSPWNIYNLAWYTGHEWDYRKFKYEFFNGIRMGMRMIPVAKKGMEPRLAELTRKIASVVDIHDVLDVPLQNHLDPEYFALSAKQTKAIKDNYDPLPIVRYTAQHEVENFVLLGNEFRESQTFESDKLTRIIELADENRYSKMAIVCRYNLQIEVLYKELTERNHHVAVIRGDVTDRDKVTVDAENTEDGIVLIQADCCEGYQLPSFELCIFASQSYSYTKWEQICGRFLRIDKPSRTTFMYLLTEGESIDQAVYDSVKKKEDFKIQLYVK